jgi:pyroglutamyl-peptidase
VALNLADFVIPDNAGARLADRPLDRRAGPALWSRLPLRKIQAAILSAGIPARLSETAGTYLCNAAMHRALQILPRSVACGFIHLPLLPAKAAQAIATAPAAPIQPSMALAMQLRGIEIALRVTVESGPPSCSPRA